MSDGENLNPIDAAAEITDAMMNSLADVVKTAISTPAEEVEQDQNPVQEESVSQENIDLTIDTTVDDLVTEGEAAHRSGDHKAALSAFNKAIALDPSNSMAWFNRGVLLEAEQDPKGARQSFVICLDLDPNHGPALANLAVLLDRLGEMDGAVEIAHRALQYFPGHPHLVKIMDSNKAAGGVIHTTPTVMPHTQDKLVEQNFTATVGSTVNDLFEETNVSQATLETVEPQVPTPMPEIVEEPEEVKLDLDTLCQSATSMLSSGDATGALQLLKEHLHNDAAQHFDSWRIAAGAMAAMGLDDHAIGAYNHAIGLNPTNAKCHFNLGALHERKGSFNEASKSFNIALENDATYTKAAYRLANISESTGDVESLLKARRHLINQEGGSNSLALLLVELAEGEAKILENTAGLPPTIPEGPALAAEAVSMCESNTQLMGRALSAAGNHTDAVKCWKGMIQSDKNNPELWTGLARSLEAAGDMATAQRCHEKAHILLNPSPVQHVQSVATGSPITEQTQAEQNPPVYSPAPVYTPPPESTVPLPEPSTYAEPVADAPTYSAPPSYSPPPVESPPPQPLPELSVRPEPATVVPEARPEVDLAAAALEATSRMDNSVGIDSTSNAIANQDIEWYNKGVGLIEDKKYREALSCFDRALPSFADNDEMVIRILNGRGNALYYLEDYPKCVESYHKAMVINPSGVQGKTLYNMGTAYAEMQRFGDAIKCFEQAAPRGLDKDQQKLAKEQIRRCNILLKEQQRKMS